MNFNKIRGVFTNALLKCVRVLAVWPTVWWAFFLGGVCGAELHSPEVADKMWT